MSEAAAIMEEAGEAASQPTLAVSIPRISIHAFCETAETAQMLQSVGADRRLQRAHVNVQTGGIQGAWEYFANAPTPNLLIVESRSSRDQLLADLARLAGVCDSGTKVIVIGHVNDVILYRELIREGVSEYVVAPLSELQVIESIANLYNDPQAAPVGRVAAFISARGGAGSSTIAHNVSWMLSEHLGLNTAIIDLDLAFGTASLNFNQDPPQGAAEALASPERLDDNMLDRLLAKCTDHLSLLAAPGAVDRDYVIEDTAIDHMIDTIRHSVPQIVVDMPTAWSPWVKHMLISADEVVITATPDLASLRNVKNIIDVLKAARPNDAAPKLVLNQTGVPKRPEIGSKEFAKALELDPVLILPYEPQLFGTAANNGQMIDEVAANSKTVEGFGYLAKAISGREMPEKQSKSLLRPLLSRMSRKRAGKGA